MYRLWAYHHELLIGMTRIAVLGLVLRGCAVSIGGLDTGESDKSTRLSMSEALRTGVLETRRPFSLYIYN